jgi:hypothetical protein
VSDTGPPGRRRVRRGEGEVTEWPRGLVDYVAKGPDDRDPSLEEDRTLNRLRLAGRLLSILRSEGREVSREVRELHVAEEAFRSGDRGRAGRLVDELLGALDARHRENAPS